MHHADAHSCELLRRLAASEPAKLLLVVSCREPRVTLATPSGGQGGNEESQYSPGHRLVRSLSSGAAPHGTVLSVHLCPLCASGCIRLGCAELGVDSLPAEVKSLLCRRCGGRPLLCQVIVRNLVHRGVLALEKGEAGMGSCHLTPCASARTIEEAATEALVNARHGVLCVKLAGLTMLQQLILKTMSLMPEPCAQALLLHALPLQIDPPVLAAQLRSLREANLISVPQSHRRSLPGVLSLDTATGALYSFVDVGMREVCQHLMVESQKRQVRLRAAAANESKHVQGSLSDSIDSSSAGIEEGTRSLSPRTLRDEKARVAAGPSPESRWERRSLRPSDDNEGAFEASVQEANRHWWLRRASLTHATAPGRSRRLAKLVCTKQHASPSRLHPRRIAPSPVASSLAAREHKAKAPHRVTLLACRTALAGFGAWRPIGIDW